MGWIPSCERRRESAKPVRTRKNKSEERGEKDLGKVPTFNPERQIFVTEKGYWNQQGAKWGRTPCSTLNLVYRGLIVVQYIRELCPRVQP